MRVRAFDNLWSKRDKSEGVGEEGLEKEATKALHLFFFLPPVVRTAGQHRPLPFCIAER